MTLYKEKTLGVNIGALRKEGSPSSIGKKIWDKNYTFVHSIRKASEYTTQGKKNTNQPWMSLKRLRGKFTKATRAQKSEDIGTFLVWNSP